MNSKLLNKSLLNYIESHISPITECGCWLWEKDGEPDKYNVLDADVDQLMYRVYRGPVPENHEVVHSCRMESCVNPQHLSLRSKIKATEKIHKKH